MYIPNYFLVHIILKCFELQFVHLENNFFSMLDRYVILQNMLKELFLKGQ
jgi:hypothetical protein